MTSSSVKGRCSEADVPNALVSYRVEKRGHDGSQLVAEDIGLARKVLYLLSKQSSPKKWILGHPCVERSQPQLQIAEVELVSEEHLGNSCSQDFVVVVT